MVGVKEVGGPGVVGSRSWWGNQGLRGSRGRGSRVGGVKGRGSRVVGVKGGWMGVKGVGVQG